MCGSHWESNNLMNQQYATSLNNRDLKEKTVKLFIIIVLQLTGMDTGLRWILQYTSKTHTHTNSLRREVTHSRVHEVI
jgi:hypothetical protein